MPAAGDGPLLGTATFDLSGRYFLHGICRRNVSTTATTITTIGNRGQACCRVGASIINPADDDGEIIICK